MRMALLILSVLLLVTGQAVAQQLDLESLPPQAKEYLKKKKWHNVYGEGQHVCHLINATTKGLWLSIRGKAGYRWDGDFPYQVYDNYRVFRAEPRNLPLEIHVHLKPTIDKDGNRLHVDKPPIAKLTITDGKPLRKGAALLWKAGERKLVWHLEVTDAPSQQAREREREARW